MERETDVCNSPVVGQISREIPDRQRVLKLVTVLMHRQ